MDYNQKTRSIMSFTKDFSKGKYNTNHRLQRKEGQWGSLQRSELIDSFLRPYPIDPIRCEMVNGVGYIFDGIQRATTIYNYLTDKFRLNRSLPNITIDGVEYNIAGKKFSQLPQEVQDRINLYEVNIYQFTDCTDYDIREMYRRQNNGRPLTSTQKRTAIEASDFSEIVFKIADHPVFEKLFSPFRIKSDAPRDCVREVFMLLESENGKDYLSFKKSDIDAFVKEYTGDNIDPEKVDNIVKALDELDCRIERVKINATSIPMLIAAAVKVISENRDFDDFVDKIQYFVDTYDTNEEYKAHCASGTCSRDNVEARWSYWKNLAAETKMSDV